MIEIGLTKDQGRRGQVNVYVDPADQGIKICA